MLPWIELCTRTYQDCYCHCNILLVVVPPVLRHIDIPNIVHDDVTAAVAVANSVDRCNSHTYLRLT